MSTLPVLSSTPFWIDNLFCESSLLQSNSHERGHAGVHCWGSVVQRDHRSSWFYESNNDSDYVCDASHQQPHPPVVFHMHPHIKSQNNDCSRARLSSGSNQVLQHYIVDSSTLYCRQYVEIADNTLLKSWQCIAIL